MAARIRFMRFIPIKIRPLLPPKDNIYPVLDKYLPKLRDGDILVITSKILAIHQGRCVRAKNWDKRALAMREADYYLPQKKTQKNPSFLTIKGHAIISSAGIDSKNGNGYYVLSPHNPSQAAKVICQYLKREYYLTKLAVIITVSHSIPLRHGTVGISLGFFGLEPLKSYTGKPGVFGRRLKFAWANLVDGLAATATIVMGEADEQTPLVIVRGAGFVTFTNQARHQQLFTKPAQDIYAPLLTAFRSKNLTERKKTSKT